MSVGFHAETFEALQDLCAAFENCSKLKLSFVIVPSFSVGWWSGNEDVTGNSVNRDIYLIMQNPVQKASKCFSGFQKHLQSACVCEVLGGHLGFQNAH